MTTRFRGGGERLETFADEVLVACPRCSSRALVRVRDGGARDPVTLTCTHCGHGQGWSPSNPGVLHARDPAISPGTIIFGPPVDPYFRLPLWLRARCCGELLWAFNAAHLAWLEAYVGATLRERAPDEHGWSNQSLTSRLPAWIRDARNRDDILRCIAELKARAT